MSTCFLNGEFIALEDARVSVLDRGFIFGDAVYEVIPVLHGQVFACAAHIERLERSLDAIAIANPCSRSEWTDLIGRVIAENGGGEQSVYVQVTRGVAERDHAFPRDIKPTVFIMSKPIATAPGLQWVSARTIEDNRWGRCDIKATSLLANVLLRNQALAAGAYEAILMRGEYVTEGAASNVFIVTHGVVKTPPLSNLILPGVTRGLLLTTLAGAGIAVVEAPVSLSELRAADEIWLTSSTRDLLLVSELDGVPCTQRNDSTLAARAYALFQDFKLRSLDPLV